MVSIGLSMLDWLIIAIYFAFIIGLGYYLKRFTKSQEDFFMAGRKNRRRRAGFFPLISAP
jgi:SSS family solute:Na+ symporter